MRKRSNTISESAAHQARLYLSNPAHRQQVLHQAMQIAGKRKAKQRPQKALRLRVPMRVELIQMADMPRYHYDVWCDFDDGDSERLGDYVHGLKQAMERARAKWGDVRVEVDRRRGVPHRPPLLLCNPKTPNAQAQPTPEQAKPAEGTLAAPAGKAVGCSAMLGARTKWQY